MMTRISWKPLTPDPIDNRWYGKVTITNYTSGGVSLDDINEKYGAVDVAWFEPVNGYTIRYKPDDRKIYVYTGGGTQANGVDIDDARWMIIGRHLREDIS